MNLESASTLYVLGEAQTGSLEAAGILLERFLPCVSTILVLRTGRLRSFAGLKKNLLEILLRALQTNPCAEVRSEASFCNWLAWWVQELVMESENQDEPTVRLEEASGDSVSRVRLGEQAADLLRMVLPPEYVAEHEDAAIVEIAATLRRMDTRYREAFMPQKTLYDEFRRNCRDHEMCERFSRENPLFAR